MNGSTMLLSLIIAIVSITSAKAASPTVLRVRTINGILRVHLPNDDPNSTLSSILESAGVVLDDDDAADDLKCQLGLPGRPSSTLDISPTGADRQKTASELGLKHGSMITILPPMDNKKRRCCRGVSQRQQRQCKRRWQ